MVTPNDPFGGLLQDLLKLIGGQGAGANAWMDAARSLAHGVATDGQPEANADPLARIGLEKLARVAELQVAEVAGLPLDRPPTVTPVGRGAFALRCLDSWATVLGRMVEAQRAAPPSLQDDADARAGWGTAGAEIEESGRDAGFDQLIGRFASTMGPVLMGMQFGSAAGHLAQRALGQYALPLPWPSSRELLVLPDNIATFADEWSLPLEETRLWVCVHELTADAVLSRPHVAERIRSLVEATTAEMVSTQQGLVERLGSQAQDPDALQRLLSDPESLLADLLTPSEPRSSGELTALTTAVSGYVDHVTRQVTSRLTASPQTLAEAWYRFRVEGASSEQVAGALLGLDLGREQVERGAAFVRGVVERAGDAALSRLWSAPRTLPTPAEVDAPGLWLERIDLPDPKEPGSEEPGSEKPGFHERSSEGEG